MYQVIPSRAEGYGPLSQRMAFDDAAKSITAESTEAGDLASVMRSDKEERALRQIVWQMFSALHTIIKNNQLCSLNESALMEQLKIGKCFVEQGKLPIVLPDLPHSVTSALKITALSRAARAVAKLDEDGNVEEPPRKEYSTTVAEKFQNRVVLFYKNQHMTMSGEWALFPVGWVLSRPA